jgi:hypothetical protein
MPSAFQTISDNRLAEAASLQLEVLYYQTLHPVYFHVGELFEEITP